MDIDEDEKDEGAVVVVVVEVVEVVEVEVDVVVIVVVAAVVATVEKEVVVTTLVGVVGVAVGLIAITSGSHMIPAIGFESPRPLSMSVTSTAQVCRASGPSNTDPSITAPVPSAAGVNSNHVIPPLTDLYTVLTGSSQL